MKNFMKKLLVAGFLLMASGSAFGAVKSVKCQCAEIAKSLGINFLNSDYAVDDALSGCDETWEDFLDFLTLVRDDENCMRELAKTAWKKVLIMRWFRCCCE